MPEPSQTDIVKDIWLTTLDGWGGLWAVPCCGRLFTSVGMGVEMERGLGVE